MQLLIDGVALPDARIVNRAPELGTIGWRYLIVYTGPRVDAATAGSRVVLTVADADGAGGRNTHAVVEHVDSTRTTDHEVTRLRVRTLARA